MPAHRSRHPADQGRGATLPAPTEDEWAVALRYMSAGSLAKFATTAELQVLEGVEPTVAALGCSAQPDARVESRDLRLLLTIELVPAIDSETGMAEGAHASGAREPCSNPV